MEAFVTQFGFPIALAVWLLYQQREHIRRCEKDVDELWGELKKLRGQEEKP